jgi:hypothetical protein
MALNAIDFRKYYNNIQLLIYNLHFLLSYNLANRVFAIGKIISRCSHSRFARTGARWKGGEAKSRFRVKSVKSRCTAERAVSDIGRLFLSSNLD